MQRHLPAAQEGDGDKLQTGKASEEAGGVQIKEKVGTLFSVTIEGYPTTTKMTFFNLYLYFIKRE